MPFTQFSPAIKLAQHILVVQCTVWLVLCYTVQSTHLTPFLLSSNLYGIMCVNVYKLCNLQPRLVCLSGTFVSHFNHVCLFVCSCILCAMFQGSDMKVNVNVFNHISRCSKCFRTRAENLYSIYTHMNRIRNIFICQQQNSLL